MRTLDELDRLHAAATQGEWVVCDRVGFWSVRTAEGETAFDDGSACDEYAHQCAPPTRDAIVALHNAWPAISARLRAAEAEVARLRRLCRVAAERIDDDALALAELLDDQDAPVDGGALTDALSRAALGAS